MGPKIILKPEIFSGLKHLQANIFFRPKIFHPKIILAQKNVFGRKGFGHFIGQNFLKKKETKFIKMFYQTKKIFGPNISFLRTKKNFGPKSFLRTKNQKCF